MFLEVLSNRFVNLKNIDEVLFNDKEMKIIFKLANQETVISEYETPGVYIRAVDRIHDQMKALSLAVGAVDVSLEEIIRVLVTEIAMPLVDIARNTIPAPSFPAEEEEDDEKPSDR
ncbi:MAG: hypothetical protein K0S71_655 [Clostridia bacterium]|nr:hypothetical protein [Clostridia bacterium]